MKAFTKLLFVAFVAMLGLVSCDKQSSLPTIEITKVGASKTSITFAVTAKDAVKVAYLCSEEGFDVISADKIISDGVVVKNSDNKVVVSGLKSNTTYYVVAAAKNELGAVMSNTIEIATLDDNTNIGGGDTPVDPGQGGNGGNNDDFEFPELDGVENVNIVKTTGGRWYEEYNYYVYFVLDNGDRIQLDFYTLSDTMSQYFPYGTYMLGDNYAPYTIHPESSFYIPADWTGEAGLQFTDAYVTVDVANGYYSIYMMLTYLENGVEKSIQGYWNGIMSNASVPAGDDTGSDKLIQLLEVGSRAFKFRINAAEDQYWRCSVVDKRVYDQYKSNPGAWVVTYGMMLNGTLTFNWEDGKDCEYVPGYLMTVTSSTDYLIIAALMDYSEGQENVLLGGVEVVQVRTKADEAGNATVDLTIKEVNVNDVVFDCVFGDDVWCCYVAMMETENLQEIKDGKYLTAGYETFEECMLSLIPGLSHDFKRQFMTSQYDYKFDGLKYNTSYTLCVKAEDMQGRVTYKEYDPFVTKQP